MLRLLRPDKSVSSVAEIDLKSLKVEGLTGIILDIDNTIMPYSRLEIPPAVMHWIEDAEEENFDICFVSNTVQKRAEFVESTLGLPAYSQCMKPMKRYLIRAQKSFDSSPENIAMIGDQIFTDIVAGNRVGYHTILVEPLEDRDFLLTRTLRWLESFLR